jgi:hypothetical protein
VKHASFWKTTTTRCITARRAFGKSRSRARSRRKDFRIDLAQLLATLPAMGLVELPITAVHAAGVTRLPPIHRDLFRPSVDCAEPCRAAYASDQRCLTRPLSSRRARGVMATPFITLCTVQPLTDVVPKRIIQAEKTPVHFSGSCVTREKVLD